MVTIKIKETSSWSSFELCIIASFTLSWIVLQDIHIIHSWRLTFRIRILTNIFFE